MAPEIRARDFEGATGGCRRIRSPLSPRAQDALRQIATVVAYRRSGVRIFSEGDDAHFVYAIGHGVVRIVRHAENGQRQILVFKTPGDLFGLPDDGAYPNTAETVSAVRLYRVPWHRLVQRMIDEPRLQLELLVRVAHDLHQAQRWAVVLGQQSTNQRMASLLLDFLRHPEFYDKRAGQLHLPINRLDLADYLGIARETAGRAITRLERNGLVRRLGSNTIQILDIAGLRALQPAPRRRSGGATEPGALKAA